MCLSLRKPCLVLDLIFSSEWFEVWTPLNKIHLKSMRLQRALVKPPGSCGRCSSKAHQNMNVIGVLYNICLKKVFWRANMLGFEQVSESQSGCGLSSPSNSWWKSWWLFLVSWRCPAAVAAGVSRSRSSTVADADEWGSAMFSLFRYFSRSHEGRVTTGRDELTKVLTAASEDHKQTWHFCGKQENFLKYIDHWSNGMSVNMLSRRTKHFSQVPLRLSLFSSGWVSNFIHSWTRVMARFEAACFFLGGLPE